MISITTHRICMSTLLSLSSLPLERGREYQSNYLEVSCWGFAAIASSECSILSECYNKWD